MEGYGRGTDCSIRVTSGAIRYLIKCDFEGIGSGIFVVGWDPNLDLKTCERRTSVADLDNVASECIPCSILRFISTSEPEPTPNQGFDWVAILDGKMNPLWERTFCSRYLSVVNVIVSDEDGDRMVDYMTVKDTAGHVYHLFPDGFWECVKLGDAPIDPAYFGPKWSQE